MRSRDWCFALRLLPRKDPFVFPSLFRHYVTTRCGEEATTPGTLAAAPAGQVSFTLALMSANEEAIILRRVSNRRSGRTVTTRDLALGCWLATNDPPPSFALHDSLLSRTITTYSKNTGVISVSDLTSSNFGIVIYIIRKSRENSLLGRSGW